MADQVSYAAPPPHITHQLVRKARHVSASECRAVRLRVSCKFAHTAPSSPIGAAVFYEKVKKILPATSPLGLLRVYRN